MTDIVVSVSVSVSNTLLLRKGNKACLGGVQSQLRVFFCFFSLDLFLLFYFIALLLPIHRCHIYCLMITTCDMMHICSHYC